MSIVHNHGNVLVGLDVVTQLERNVHTIEIMNWIETAMIDRCVQEPNGLSDRWALPVLVGLLALVHALGLPHTDDFASEVADRLQLSIQSQLGCHSDRVAI